MSWIPARIKSLEEARGIMTLVGYQESVSQIRKEQVSAIQSVQH
jgi:hypothetical protein